MEWTPRNSVNIIARLFRSAAGARAHGPGGVPARRNTPASEISVTVIDLPQARRLAFGVVLGQVAVTVMAGVLAWAVSGGRPAFSALLGGGIGTVASLVMVLVAFGGGTADAHGALGAFYRGEVLKVVVVIGLFVAAFKTMKVAPLAMFAAFAATFFVYWIALSAALWPGGRARNEKLVEPAPPAKAGVANTVRDRAS